ncbi:MAG: preprotein translocase subunit SecE [Patescibacteria group bacterium]
MPNSIFSYFLESKAELKKVSWPSRKETVRHTALVVAVSLGLAAFLGVADYFLTLGLEQLLSR